MDQGLISRSRGPLHVIIQSEHTLVLIVRNLLNVLNGRNDRNGEKGGLPAKFLPKSRGLRTVVVTI